MREIKIKSLKEKIKIQNFRSDEWFDENIWESDLDENDIVELILNEVSTDVKISLQNLKDEIKEASEHIKVCDKVKQRGKEIILSEDLCSVKDVEIFLNKINKAFKKHIGELE